MRSPSKNMCSVRHKADAFGAEGARAMRASVGVSALARTPCARVASAHSMMRPKSPDSSGLMVGISPRMTWPVDHRW
jgi:hypothetical protein